MFSITMRYSRQEIFIGSKAQKLLNKSLVVIVGCGGTGSVAAEYLARAGVSLRLIDRDVVELSNLQRQLYTESDVGKPKAKQLKKKLESVNREIRIESVDDDLNADNIDDHFHGASIIVDGTDNLPTRFLINDWCLKNRVPFTYAAALKSEGLVTVIIPRETPCLQCFIPPSSAGDTCETSGVLGPAVGAVGTISAVETIKYLTGKPLLKGSMLHLNFYKNIYELLGLAGKKNCPACSGQYKFLDQPSREITQLCGGTYQYKFDQAVNLYIIASKIGKTGEFTVIQKNDGMVKMKHGDCVISLFKNRMLLQNIHSVRAVKTVAAKLLG